ncbi:hypothetical protein CLV51_10482 [Chitinophaga niastensis]|uniref:Uncharacterized protein n=1 Tax=Chitinophaga niastensis TaxID=536980 RepID=A0A2P8HGR6_CHINA|nr:hypothetical protein CLV51_10482 [Chitinophaga niastensis]
MYKKRKTDFIINSIDNENKVAAYADGELRNLANFYLERLLYLEGGTLNFLVKAAEK